MIMEIKSEKQFREYQSGCEELIRKGTALGGMNYLSDTDKREYIRLSDAVIEYEAVYYPLPGCTSGLTHVHAATRMAGTLVE